MHRIKAPYIYLQELKRHAYFIYISIKLMRVGDIFTSYFTVKRKKNNMHFMAFIKYKLQGQKSIYLWNVFIYLFIFGKKYMTSHGGSDFGG